MPKSRPQGFPARLDVAIENKGINTLELEKLTEGLGLRVSNSTISRYRNGKRDNPDAQHVAVLARALDVSSDWLLRDENPPAWLTGSPTRTVIEPIAPEMPADLRAVLDAFPWPSGMATADVAAISDGLRKEWFAHRNSYIPPRHWHGRIEEEIAARRGKRQQRESAAADLETTSPEVADYKAKKRRR